MVRYVLIFLVLLVSIDALAQQPVSIKNEAQQLKKLIFQHHLDPKPIDNSFSRQVFDLLVNTLDPDKLYFTQEDITALSVFREKVDDELTGNGWDFLKVLTERYKKSLNRTEALIAQHTKQPFDFTKKEIFIIDTLWAANDAAISTLWYKNLKYETLDELVHLHKRTPALTDKEFVSKKESEARQRVQRNCLRPIHRILNPGSET